MSSTGEGSTPFSRKRPLAGRRAGGDRISSRGKTAEGKNKDQLVLLKAGLYNSVEGFL